MRYWSATNPNVLLETPLYPQKVTVWCGFHAGGVIGRYFFVVENDRHVTVNEDLTLMICGFNKTVYSGAKRFHAWPKFKI